MTIADCKVIASGILLIVDGQVIDVRSSTHDELIIGNSFVVYNEYPFNTYRITGEFASPSNAAIQLTLYTGWTFRQLDNTYYIFDKDRVYDFEIAYNED